MYKILTPAAKLMQRLAMEACWASEWSKRIGPGKFLERYSKEEREVLTTLKSDDIMDQHLFLPK